MRKLFVLIALVTLSGSLFAQSYTPLLVKRFSATLSTPNQFKNWSTSPTIVASQTDTSDWFYFNTDDMADTLFEMAFHAFSADSTKIAIKTQFGLNGSPRGNTTQWTDSLVKVGTAGAIVVTAAPTDSGMVGRALWFRRTVGSNCVRFIVYTGATGNSLDRTTGGLLDAEHYQVGVVTRSKQTKKTK